MQLHVHSLCVLAVSSIWAVAQSAHLAVASTHVHQILISTSVLIEYSSPSVAALKFMYNHFAKPRRGLLPWTCSSLDPVVCSSTICRAFGHVRAGYLDNLLHLQWHCEERNFLIYFYERKHYTQSVRVAQVPESRILSTCIDLAARASAVVSSYRTLPRLLLGSMHTDMSALLSSFPKLIFLDRRIGEEVARSIPI